MEIKSNEVINNSIEEIAGIGMLEQVLIEPIVQIPLVEGGKEEGYSKDGLCCAGLITQKKTEKGNTKADFTEGIPSIKNKFDALGNFAEEGEIAEVNISPVIQILYGNATQEVLLEATDLNKEGIRLNEDSSSIIKKKGMK
ncbi:hypothetical protein MA16_Dca019339 [Dendrobium catenatum]|uniref:Uncharacterized protein n=1 Tax=Dendrobium catenatum TaxID=906689 RepID=A0A2I0WHZ6_9ASPA|nr:hypothetical protein MA16_Dca019339 [Dendrobium catenatum]